MGAKILNDLMIGVEGGFGGPIKPVEMFGYDGFANRTLNE